MQWKQGDAQRNSDSKEDIMQIARIASCAARRLLAPGCELAAYAAEQVSAAAGAPDRSLRAGRRHRHHRAPAADAASASCGASRSSSTTAPAPRATSRSNWRPESTPDGYTLLVGNVSTNAINETTFSSLKIKPSRDLTGVTNLIQLPHLWVVNPTVPAIEPQGTD